MNPHACKHAGHPFNFTADLMKHTATLRFENGSTRRGGSLFIRGSRLVDHSPWFALAGRWLPAAGALAICLLGGGITWRSVSKLFG